MNEQQTPENLRKRKSKIGDLYSEANNMYDEQQQLEHTTTFVCSAPLYQEEPWMDDTKEKPTKQERKTAQNYGSERNEFLRQAIAIRDQLCHEQRRLEEQYQ